MEAVRSLPYRVPLIDGESTGSYVTRLAARHGESVGHLLATVGEGKTAAEVDPRLSELYLTAAARQRLAALAGRPLAQLTRALASLRDEYLLPGLWDTAQYQWPWRPLSGYLVRGCALCAARRGVFDTVWLIRPDPWHICVRHGRFHDTSRDDRVPFLDLSPGPHVVEAEQRRIHLVRRLGPVGRLLVADAFAVLARPGSFLPRLGTNRTTPLRLLPGAIHIADRMAQLERLRLDSRLVHSDYSRWLKRARDDLGGRVGTALERWSALHKPLQLSPLPQSRAARWPVKDYRQPASPHLGPVPEMAPLHALSCLRWDILARDERRPYG
ncbi:TniQ family protein [Streptomyces althioticus]|uniref:TniQ family protein n=1 Tax=Streptomyces althioticus TaxID=83380 RepID=UPI00370293DE